MLSLSQPFVERHQLLRARVGTKFLESMEAEWLHWIHVHRHSLPVALQISGLIADGRASGEAAGRVPQRPPEPSPIRVYDARLDQAWVA